LFVSTAGFTITPSPTSTLESVSYFPRDYISLDWSSDGLGSSCFCRLRASAKTMSASPGTYSAWYEGKLADSDGDTTLEEYGHHWQSCSSSVTYSSKPNGYYLFTVSCSASTTDYAFKLDTVSPVASIYPHDKYDPSPSTQTSYSFGIAISDTHGGSPAYAEPVTVTQSGELAGIWFFHRVDNGNWIANEKVGPASVLGLGTLAAGPHCVEIMARDLSGSSQSDYAEYCWTVETFTKYTGCTFSYSINSAESQTTSSTSVAMTDLPDGTNSFALKAIDMYGNPTPDDLTNTFTWTVDTIKPVTTFATSGTWEDSELVTSSKGTFTYKSSESGSFFKYQVDGGVVVTAPTATTQVFPSGTFDVKSCSGTSHSFSAFAIDPLGNIGDSVSSTFTVEPINTALSLSNAASGVVVASSTVVFSISAVVDNSAPSSFAYEYKVDDGSWQNGKHFPKFGVRGLSDGEHNIKARSITTGGCADPSPYSLTFIVDTTPPKTTMFCPNSPSNAEDLMVYGMVEDNTVKSTGTQYKLGSASYSTPGNPVVGDDGTFAVSLENLEEGQYTLYTKSTDTAGLTGEETSCTWVVDFGPPDTMIIQGPPTPQYIEDYNNFTFRCTEFSCKFSYSVDGTGWMDAENNMASLVGLPEGVHTMHVYATDAAGNADPSPAAYTWTIYEAEMYSQYCTTCSFQFKGPLPGQYQPRGDDFLHGIPGTVVPEDPYDAKLRMGDMQQP